MFKTIQLIKNLLKYISPRRASKVIHSHSQILKEKKQKNITLKSEFLKLHIHVNLTVNK